MTTATRSARPNGASTDPYRACRRLMRVNGGFLAAVGAVQVALELLAYYAAAGPYASAFAGSPYTIGWIENHGLAFLIGILFITVGARAPGRAWHLFAMAVHVLLAAANIAFWSSFVTFGVIPMGIAATVAHLALILAHAHCLVRNHGRAATSP